MPHIIVPHILHYRRQVILTPVISVIRKVRNLDELLLVCHRCHYMIQLLELFLCEV